MISKKPRYLITTANERTWKVDQPILFLGDWCKLYSRRKFWDKLDSETVPYHWKDRTRLQNDYNYLCECFERVLPILANQLNEIHGVNLSMRYWRILIGPWLAYFIHILFDRWCSIQDAVLNFRLTGTTVIVGRETEMVPNDMKEFYECMSGDEWNHYIYSVILKIVTNIPIDELSVPIKPIEGIREKHKTSKSMLVKIFRSITSKFVSDRDLFLISTYLPTSALFRLYLRFNQVPQHWISIEPSRSKINWLQRESIICGNATNDFENCLIRLIPKQLPAVFVEGYKNLDIQIGNLPWPKHPIAIFTSNALWFDTVSMAYIAKKVSEGTPLIYGQHGGVYGIAKYAFGEEHEIAISNRFISWGWDSPSNAKISPVGMLKRPNKASQYNKTGKLLLIGMSTFSRYSYLVTSESAIDIHKYIEGTFEFTNALPNSIQKDLLVRLTSREVGWFLSERWRNRFPSVQLDLGKKRMLQIMCEARLVVCTYNSTNFLEAIALNIPTIIFCDFNETPLRESAYQFFEDLISVGIVHKTPQSAAAHVIKVWDEIEVWWARPELQVALERFRTRFCKSEKRILDHIENIINNELYMAT